MAQLGNMRRPFSRRTFLALPILSSLRAEPLASYPANAPTVRRVLDGLSLENSGRVMGNPSPDGRLFAFPDWDSGDLALAELPSGKKRSLTGKASWSQSTEFVMHPVFSPDGQQIVYSWNAPGGWQLRILNLRDGTVKTLLRAGKDIGNFRPHAWCAGGKLILAAITRRDSIKQIVLITIADGSLRVLRTLDLNAPDGMAVSPDGEWIGFDLQDSDRRNKSDILVMNLDGGQFVTALSGPPDDQILGWGPKGIVFASDRGGKPSLWSLKVTGNRPGGSPVRLRDDLGAIHPLGFTQTGDYFFGRRRGKPEVFLAELDISSKSLRDAPRPAAPDWPHATRAPQWSPDGSRLAYLAAESDMAARARVIHVRETGTGTTRRLTPDLEWIVRLGWYPDGRALLVQCYRAVPGLYRVDLESAAVSMVVPGSPQGLARQHWLAPDGETVLFTREGPAAVAVVARNLNTGAEREVCRAAGNVRSLSLSHDGTKLAFVFRQDRRSAVTVVDVATGNAREVFHTEDEPPMLVAWGAGSRHLFLSRRGQTAAPELWRLDLEEKTEVALGFGMAGMNELVVHPDGRQLAFVAGLPVGDVWVAERLLPR